MKKDLYLLRNITDLTGLVVDLFDTDSLSSSFVWQLILFGEIVLAQKVMYEKFGDDFLLYFLSKGLLTGHCPQHLVEQYCQKLQVIDVHFVCTFSFSLDRKQKFL